MSKSDNSSFGDLKKSEISNGSNGGIDEEGSTPAKGPLNFLSGSITSIFLGWLCLGVSEKVVVYFSLHSPSYSSPIAQSIGSALKTLIIGMCFLATFTFSFIGLGLFLVFIRSLFERRN